MPRGTADIPILRLEVLEDFMRTFMTPPELFFMNRFTASQAASADIKWESQRGGRGMTPFAAPGAPAQVTAPHGIAQHSATAAFWKEKMYFDEEFLNNLRKPGTTADYHAAEQKLAEELAGLKNRSDRRKEWMFVQMLFNNGFSYAVKGGYKVTIDYGIPSDHRVTLASAYNWDNGGSKNILSDIQDGKTKIKEDCGGVVDVAMCNSNVLKYIGNDTTIRQLLYNSYFGGPGGPGNLYGGNLHEIVGVNVQVLGRILNIPNFIVYDEMYEVKAWLVAAVTGGSTTWITLDDVSDFKAGGKVRFLDVSEGTYEYCYIKSVETETNRIQLSYPPASSYKAGEDQVFMPEYYIPNDKFLMMASTVDGMPIAKYMEAPFSLPRQWGQKVDDKYEWDPEGVWIRVQDKGLPIIKNRDAIYTLDVKSLYTDTLTSTTTTSSSSTTTTTA